MCDIFPLKPIDDAILHNTAWQEEEILAAVDVEVILSECPGNDVPNMYV